MARMGRKGRTEGVLHDTGQLRKKKAFIVYLNLGIIFLLNLANAMVKTLYSHVKSTDQR